MLYADHEFTYLECDACQSLFCDPMPDAIVLSQMYGMSYATSPTVVFDCGDTSDPEWVRSHLPGRGVFVDYGCGNGSLLKSVATRGLRTIGVEFDSEVARGVTERTGSQCLTPTTLTAQHHGFADVVHVGDVLEHLTDMDTQFPAILRLLRPGGLLLAQGPLEANWCLFFEVLRLQRRLRRGPVRMAPYHVMLASKAGQRALFARFGLKEMELLVDEASWPAPARLDAGVVRDRRALALYALRKASQALSAFRPSSWGNRYRYAGRILVGRTA